MSGSMPVRAAVLWERVGLVTSPEEEFAEFASASAPRLRRAAFLLCGDWHTAEDLAQTALAKVFVSWRKVRRQDAAHAYATRTVFNCYLADKRRRRSTEILTGQLPDSPVMLPAPETRMDVLGCSPGTVKTLGARALDKLRAVLGDVMTDPGPPRHPPGDRHQAKESRHG